MKVVIGPLHPPISTYIFNKHVTEIYQWLKGKYLKVKQLKNIKCKTMNVRFEGRTEPEREKGTPLYQDALSQMKQLVPNPNSRQPNHFYHASQITCQVSQPI